jgi:hypothetical protein
MLPGVSKYIFNCPTGQTCAVMALGEGSHGNNWGCCNQVPVPGCSSLRCPTYSTCINSASLKSCGSACMTNSGILKWFVELRLSIRSLRFRKDSLTTRSSDSLRPSCATGNAIMASQTPGPSGPTTYSQYGCADYPYDLYYTVFEENMYTMEACAPEWILTPASVAAWSSSEAPELSSAYAVAFANPFDALTARSNFSASTRLPPMITGSSLTGSQATVVIPTAPGASSTTHTSGTVKTTSVSGFLVPLALLLAVGNIWLL